MLWNLLNPFENLFWRLTYLSIVYCNLRFPFHLSSSSKSKKRKRWSNHNPGILFSMKKRIVISRGISVNKFIREHWSLSRPFFMRAMPSEYGQRNTWKPELADRTKQDISFLPRAKLFFALFLAFLHFNKRKKRLEIKPLFLR